MKKTLFLAAALLTISIGNAQIVNGRIGTGDITIAGVDWTDAYGIDFNNDGTLEFRISDFEGIDGNWANAYISYDWTEGGNNVVADPEMWDYVALLNSGDVIDANGNFAGYGDATFEDLTTAPERIFLGFRIQLADGVHYGWAEATVTASAISTDITLTWVACAYNTTPGAAIAAGQTGGGVGIDATAAPAFRAFALGQNSLRIETGHNEVSVYDLGGRLLNTVRGDATLTMPQAGVYLLRAEGTTRKMLVY